MKKTAAALMTIVLLFSIGFIGPAEGQSKGATHTAGSPARIFVKTAAAVPAALYAGMKRIASAGKSFYMGFACCNDTWSCCTGMHKVTFTHDIYVDTTKVKQPDFQALMGFNPSNFTTAAAGENAAMLPVDAATWFDAALYCNARSKRDGLDTVYTYTSVKHWANPNINPNCVQNLGNLAYDITKNGYRLPTNAEYEYLEGAGKTGDSTTYFWGTTYADDSATKYSWSSVNAGGRSHAVAMKAPNPFGLYDITGDLFEWEGDWDSTYRAVPQTDPTGSIAPALENCGPSMAAKCAKGGSWSSDAQDHQRISYHYKWPDSATGGAWGVNDGEDGNQLGFRCVATISTTPVLQNSSSPADGENTCRLEDVVGLRSGDIQLNFLTTSISLVQVDCYNALGRLVRSASISNPHNGANQVILKGGLSNGMTIICLKQDGKVYASTSFVENK